MFSHEQQDDTLINASGQEQPGNDSISLQPQSPWMNQFVSGDEKASVEGDIREARFITGNLSQRPERRMRDRGVIREGLNSTTGPEAYSRIKNSRRDSSSQRLSQETTASQGNVFPVSLCMALLQIFTISDECWFNSVSSGFKVGLVQLGLGEG